MTHPDDMPAPLDGPPPARAQRPRPRRRRQSHIEPQLRTPGSAGTGTPFTAFTTDGAPDATRNTSTECCERGGQADRAAAFQAGTHRGRGGRHCADH